MAERSALNQVVQLGIEASPGSSTVNGGFKRLQAIGIEPSPRTEIDQFRPAGTKYRGFTALGKEWVQAAVSGRPTYQEIVYFLASVMTKPTNPAIAGATNTKAWLFQPSNSADDAPKTYKVEHGSAFRADSFGHGIFTEMGMTFSRSSIELTGSMIGRQITDGITMTGSPTTISPLVPVQPTQLSVFVADEYANFATSTIYGADAAHGVGSSPAGNSGGQTGEGRMVRVVSAEWSLGNRFAPLFTLDAISGISTYGSSFVGVIESEPDLTMSVTAMADSEGMGFLQHLRDGDTKFFRVEGNGPTIDGSITGGTGRYKMRLDTATRIVDTGGFRDEDGIYAVEWSMVGINDGTWGRPYQATVWNTLTDANLVA